MGFNLGFKGLMGLGSHTHTHTHTHAPLGSI